MSNSHASNNRWRDFQPQIEPRVSDILEITKRKRLSNLHRLQKDSDIANALVNALDLDKGSLTDLRRMSGGASKEQYSFLRTVKGVSEKLVLRMDPVGGLVESCRMREAEVMCAMGGIVPVPQVIFVDGDGSTFESPALITSFVDGITKPPQSISSVSGLGMGMNKAWRQLLSEQFIDHLVRIHAVEFDESKFSSFTFPNAHPFQAATFQINWWSKVWNDYVVDPLPIVSVAESWLRANTPACEDIVLVHGDYRTGNFLFDETSGKITAILDWELSHFGDFHEDLTWSLQPIFCTKDEKSEKIYASGLMERDDFINTYEIISGRTVNSETLKFYEVLNAWKAVIIDLSSGLAAARDGNNHQNILLTWLAASAHIEIEHIAKLLIK